MEQTKDERIRALLTAKNERDSGYLIGALVDPDIRFMAAAYLGDIGATEAVPALLRLLSVGHPKTRTAAARALGRLSAVEAVPRLMELAANDPDLAARSHSIQALANIGDRRAQSLLIDLLDDSNWLLRSDVVYALGVMGDEGAIAPLQAAASKRSLFRRRAYRKAMRNIRRRTRM